MMENLVKEKIKGLKPYAPVKTPCAIKLDANENNNLSTLLNQKIAKAIMEVKVNQYPDSDAVAIRQILAKELGVSKDQLVMGCGSDQLILMVLNAFLNVGEKILTPAPTFSMYRLSNEIVGGETIEVPMDEDFKFNYYPFIKAIKKENPKLIFLSNPNNPTGGIIPREQIIKIVELSNAVVVVDEAYFEFYQESVMDLVNYYPNLIVLRTLSKAYGLAGARIGYAIASKEATNILRRVKPPYNISSLDQVAAQVCLENKERVEAAVQKTIEERGRMATELEKIKGLRVYDSHGNFILVRVEDAYGMNQYLLNKGILVRFFGEGVLADCLRISIGNENENTSVLNRIKEYYLIQSDGLPIQLAK